MTPHWTIPILLELMEERNVSQRELAVLSGICRKTFSRYIRGEHPPHILILERLLKALGHGLEIVSDEVRNEAPQHPQDLHPRSK